MHSSFPHVIFLTSANYLQLSQNKNLASVRYFVSKAFLKKKKKSQFTVTCSSRASSSCVTEPVCLGKCLKKKKKGSQKESGFDL